MADDAGLVLERFIVAQFEGLSLTVPSDDVEMMARFVEEDMEREDKVEGVRGMLEGVVETMPDDATLSPALDAILDEQDRLVAEAEAAASAAAALAAEAAAEEEKRNAKPDVAAVLASLTDEEIAAARKAALIRQYAYVEGGPEEDPLRKDGPPRANGKEEAEAKRAAEERRRLVEEALRLDGKKKKYRKKEIDDPLEWANLNKEKVAVASAMQRQQASKAAMDRRERDKAALDKQRADQAKAKADRQKKAQKQERRG